MESYKDWQEALFKEKVTDTPVDLTEKELKAMESRWMSMRDSSKYERLRLIRYVRHLEQRIRTETLSGKVEVAAEKLSGALEETLLKGAIPYVVREG